MKPFWRTTLKVLKVIGKIFVWLTGADSPVKDDEKRNDYGVNFTIGVKTPVWRAAEYKPQPFFHVHNRMMKHVSSQIRTYVRTPTHVYVDLQHY